MSSFSHRLLRNILPPMISRPLARRFLDVRYTGDYASWADALQATVGYDAPNILEQVTAAARLVRDRKAAFERDGVVFERPEYRWPLVASLLREAVKHDGRLRVLDFGGSLGSTYFQNRSWLKGVRELRWGVVEQEKFVEVGQREFASPELGFFPTIEAAWAALSPNVVLFSGVLAWLEQPHAVLGQVIAAAPPAIIVDRTPLTPLNRDVIKIQRVPAKIYPASYPCWFLGRERFLAHFRDAYVLRAEFPPLDAHVPGSKFEGLYFEHKASLVAGA